MPTAENYFRARFAARSDRARRSRERRSQTQMKSPLFNPKTRERIEGKVRDLLNQQADFLSEHSAESTRAAGDAIQSVIEDGFAEILADLIGEYSVNFARRAMADLAFKDKFNNYYVVDVKTHR